MTKPTSTSDGIDHARLDLECAITDVGAVAKILLHLDETNDALCYLGHNLWEHHKALYDAFQRIYRLNQYAPGKGGAA